MPGRRLPDLAPILEKMHGMSERCSNVQHRIQDMRNMPRSHSQLESSFQNMWRLSERDLMEPKKEKMYKRRMPARETVAESTES